MTEAVTAVGTSVLVFVPFGQVVMSYRHLRLLNRSTNDTRRSCNGRRYERACEEFHGWAGKLRWALGGAGVSRAREVLRQLVGEAMPKPHAERPTRRAVAPHDVLDGNRIKAGTFEGSYLVADFRQAADVLPVLTGECLKGAGYQVVAGARFGSYFRPRTELW